AVDAAGALLELDERLGPLLRLQLLRQHAVGVEDRVVRADRPARATVDAEAGVDVVHLLLDAVDRGRRTAPLAGRAAGTAVDDGERHGLSIIQVAASGKRRRAVSH